MQFPNEVQCAILFERGGVNLDAVVRRFLELESGQMGLSYNMVEARAGTYYQMYGSNRMMVSLEFLNQPASYSAMGPSLGSPLLRMTLPDAEERLGAHRSHVLINVTQGVMPHLPEFTDLLRAIGMTEDGANLPDFIKRLATCERLTSILLESSQASIVHWTQSNQLLSPSGFDEARRGSVPNLLCVHPILSLTSKDDGQQLVGFRTLGAAHFIGREIVVQPTTLPWHACYQTALAFMRLATMPNGYIIPDGDSFGPEDQSQSFRVSHLSAPDGSKAVYALEPLFYREFGFQAETYVPRDQPVDASMLADAVEPEVLDDWQAQVAQKRAMAEAAGVQLAVRTRAPDAPRPVKPEFAGRRVVFGRKVS